MAKNHKPEAKCTSIVPPMRFLLLAATILFVGLESPDVYGLSDQPHDKRELYQRVTDASLIVRGTVITSEATFRDVYQEGKIVGKDIHTTITFAVKEMIKGSVEDSVLTFDVIGGTLGGLSQVVSPWPMFPVTEKDEAVLFFEDTPLGREIPRGGVLLVRNGIVDLVQGRIPITEFTRYLRLISGGETVKLDSFLSASPSPSAPSVRGGTLPPGEIRIFEDSDTSSTPSHHDTVTGGPDRSE